MRVLIAGSDGQLGSELRRLLDAGHGELGSIPKVFNGAVVTGVDVDTLDIADTGAALAFGTDKTFDIIINCAAMTNVDACESSVDAAYRVNALGARNIALLANKTGAKLAHISTDYVFSGEERSPRREWDAPAPSTVYGKSKLLGEQYVREGCARSFILRTAWLYGYTGGNFVKTILGVARDKGSLKVVDDQRGNPTNAADLAHHILKLAATDCFGVYHCTGEGECSWYDFAREIIRLSGVKCDITPCTTEEFLRPAPRPKYSSLDKLGLRCTVGNEMRSWEAAIAAYMEHYDRESGEVRL